ncbi:MAG: ABC transporter substrate-binding protein [Rubrimonas sp.]|uniref:ABC transporter substrate-binding protein n=1 Tax=Rubrimonas sp. TaxID=2036015 RepID=UPI002FDE7EED
MTSITRRQSLALLGGATAAAALATPALASRKTVVGALRLTSHAGSFAALKRGYFAEAGLDAELKFFEAAQPMALAIASGDVDFGMTAITGGLISLADKGAVKVIGGALSEEKGIAGQVILASNAAFDAGLDAPGKLGGRSFGSTTPGSSFHYMGAKIAAAEGATVEFRHLQKVGAVIGALKSGQIDAWSIVPHIGQSLAASGGAKIIGQVADYLPGYQVTTLFTSARNAAEERALTEGFVAAVSRGVADYNAALVEQSAGEAARDAMVALIHEHVYSDRPLAEAAPSILAGAMRLNEGAALNMASVADQLDWFKAEGMAPASITLETLVDPSFVAAI